MKIAGLVIGILLTVFSGITAIVCLMLPSMTNNRVNFKESLVGLIPAITVGIISLIVTLIFAVLLIMERKKAVQGPIEENK
ncbi:hypothetical protein BH10ACI3_BH10ACI3_24430 [soil metagenome]